MDDVSSTDDVSESTGEDDVAEDVLGDVSTGRRTSADDVSRGVVNSFAQHRFLGQVVSGGGQASRLDEQCVAEYECKTARRLHINARRLGGCEMDADRWMATTLISWLTGLELGRGLTAVGPMY